MHFYQKQMAHRKPVYDTFRPENDGKKGVRVGKLEKLKFAKKIFGLWDQYDFESRDIRVQKVKSGLPTYLVEVS